MAKLIEMDESVTLKDQIESQVAGPVILINKFNVKSNEKQQFLKAWEEDATKFKDQPGLVFQGIGNSNLYINYAVWESLSHFKNAVDKVMGPDPQSQLSKYPESIILSPHLLKKIAVPGICGD
jgi:hypothetical protein